MITASTLLFRSVALLANVAQGCMHMTAKFADPSDVHDELEGFPARLLMSIHGIPDEQLRIVEREGAWSILDVISHLSDFELVTGLRLRMIMSAEQPTLHSFDQDRFVSLHRGRSKADLVRELSFLRRMNLSILRRLSDEEVEREGRHVEFGVVSIRGLVARVVDHQNKHLRQIERIKTTLVLRRDAIDAGGWESSAALSVAPRKDANGIRVRDIWTDGWRLAQFVEIDPGAQFSGVDYHVPGPEEIFVVSGVLDDGVGEHAAGTFVHYPAGSSHIPRSKEGCALFIFYPEG